MDRFPAASFESSDAIRTGQGRYRLTGRLAIRDSVHTVQLDAEVPVLTEDRLQATAPLTFDRNRWGVRFDGATSPPAKRHGGRRGAAGDRAGGAAGAVPGIRAAGAAGGSGSP